MDINQLKTFITISETQSLTKAASLLFLSQPALSTQLKLLEAELGVQLFTRTPKGMLLTTEGVALKKEASNTIEAMKTLQKTAKSLSHAQKVECRLGTISSPLILHLPTILLHLKSQQPEAQLTINQHISGIIIDKIMNDELDAGFIIGNVEQSALNRIVLSDITLCIVGPWDWKAQYEQADWDEIATAPWISTPEKCSFNAIAEKLFQQHHQQQNTIITSDEENTLSKLVKLNLGFTLLREDVALSMQAKKEVFIWEQGKTISQLCFVYPQAKAQSPIIHSLISFVKSLWPYAE